MTWTTFSEWLTKPETLENLLFLLEVSPQFPRGAYNALFNQQLERLVAQAGSPETKAELEQALGMDWCGYIAKALRSSGFRDHDVDPLTHEVVIRLLVNPGALFKGWGGQPILPRFKLSVRNAVINLAQKQQTRRRRIPATSIHHDDDNAAMDIEAPAATSHALIDQFRDFLRRRHGAAAVEVLDHRLNGAEVKELIGQPGLETSYRLKQVVQAIKQAAEEFAHDEPELLGMIRRAMASEAETVARRFSVKSK